MRFPPTLGKRAFVPFSLLGINKAKQAKRDLLFSQVSHDRVSHILRSYEPSEEEDEYDYAEFQYSVVGERVTVNEYRETPFGVSMPRDYAMQMFPDIKWKDNTKWPTHDIPFNGRITPRDPRQELFFNSLLQQAEQSGPQNILAIATTGSGKTVAGIYLGWQLSTPTLIVVDSNKIANGWLKNFRQFFGQGWTERNVGRVQQDTVNFKSKAFTITLAQSIARRQYPPAFYRHFGLLLVDEIQVFGGPHFSPILYMFPARVRVGLTAEEKHSPFGKLIRTHLGRPKVVSMQEVLKPHAYILRNELKGTFWCYTDGAIQTNLSRVRERNERIAGLIKNRGFDRQRVVLVLSDRTRQLLELRNMCRKLGVPDHQMGIHAGRYETNRRVLYYKLEGSNKRNRFDVFDTQREATRMKERIRRKDYDGIRMPEALYNRLQAGEKIEWEISRENYQPSQHELDNITHSCQIIFATYKIFAKGVDVPRLDMGVEALPAGNVKQPVGRILRLKEGKATPEWYAIHDHFGTEGWLPATAEAKVLTKYFNDTSTERKAALKRAGAKIKTI